MGEIYDNLENFKLFLDLYQEEDESSHQFANRVYNHCKALDALFLQKEMETLTHLQILMGLNSDEQRDIIIENRFSFDHLINFDVIKDESVENDQDLINIHEMIRLKQIEEDLPMEDDGDEDDDNAFTEEVNNSDDKLLNLEEIHKCEECNKPFVSEEAYQGHREIQFNCETCDAIFNCKPTFILHKTKTHPARLKCCNKIFKNSHELRNHKKERHEFTPKKCFNCLKLYTNKREYDWHIERMCKRCNLCLTSVKAATSHWRHVHKESYKPYTRSAKCPQCNKIFTTESTAKRHFKQVHMKEQHTFQCHICSYTTYDQIQLNGHISKYHEIVQVDCDKCSKTFNNMMLLYKHVASVHNKKAKCLKCKSTYETLEELDQHACVPFENWETTSTATLKLRQSCPHCPKTYCNRYILKSHIESEHQNFKRYKCSECDYGCSQKDHLKKHFTFKHLNERPFVCSECGKTFHTNNKLQRHVEVVHIGIKKICNICNASIAGYGYGNMKAHQTKVHKEFTYREWEQSQKVNIIQEEPQIQVLIQ